MLSILLGLNCTIAQEFSTSSKIPRGPHKCARIFLGTVFPNVNDVYATMLDVANSHFNLSSIEMLNAMHLFLSFFNVRLNCSSGIFYDPSNILR